MSVLQKESPGRILDEAIARAVKQGDLLRRTGRDVPTLFDELVNAVTRGGMLRTTSRFIVGQHIEKPYLNNIVAQGGYGKTLTLVDFAQLAYLRFVSGLMDGENKEAAVVRFRKVVFYQNDPSDILAKRVMPWLTDRELNGVLQAQEAGFHRCAAEVDERVVEQYLDIHG